MSDFDLPKNWEVTKLGNLAEYINGRAFKPTEWQETGKPIIRIQNLNNPNAHYNFFSGEIAEKYHVHYGDLLYAWSASLDTFIWKGEEAFLNQHIFNVKPYANISKLFIFYLLKFVSSDILSQTHGSGMVHITKGKFDDIPVSLPPLNEQNRIVAKIEALFSEIDNGIDSLSKAKFQLEQYRQSLLKSAFEGKLTEQWRADYEKNNGKPLPTVDELLKQIQDARQAHYDQQLAEWELAVKAWKENGKEGKKPVKPKYLEKLETLLADNLPENWLSINASYICDFITKGTTPAKPNLYNEKGDIPFIKVYNLTKTGKLDFTINPTFTDIETHNNFLARSKVFPNDILMNIVGPPLGKVSIVPDDYPEWNINQAIVIFRPLFLLPKYLKSYLLSDFTIKDMEKQGKTTAGQFNLTLEICRNVPIPICSKEEQNYLNDALEARLSEIDKNISEIITQLKKAEILKSAILQKAFQGKLAAQDDNDPPASELLEQIKQEREQALALIQEAKQAKKATKPKTTKRTKKAKTTENQ